MQQDTQRNSPQIKMWQIWLWYHICPPFLINDLHNVSWQCSYHFLLVNNVFQPLEILPFESCQNKQGILLVLLHFLDCTFRICDPERCLATHIFFKALHWCRVQPAGQPEKTLSWIPTYTHACWWYSNDCRARAPCTQLLEQRTLTLAALHHKHLWSFIPSHNSLIRSYFNYYIECNANHFCIFTLVI